MKYIICLIFAVFCVGCANFSEVQTKVNPDEVEVKSVKGRKFKIHIPIDVDNPTTHKLILKKAKFDILKKGYSFAKIELEKRIEVPRQSINKYIITLKGVIVDPMGAMFTRFDYQSSEFEDYTLSGYAKVGTALLSKKIRLKNESFQTLFDRLSNN